MPVDYHAWTHRPKALGGTDPIELATLDLVFVRGVDQAGDDSIAVPSGTWTTIGDWLNVIEQGSQTYLDIQTFSGTKHIAVNPGCVFTLSGCIEWGATFTATRRVRIGPSGSWSPQGSGPIEFDLGEEGNNNSFGTTLMTSGGSALLTVEVWQDSGSSQNVVGDTSVLLVLLGVLE